MASTGYISPLRWRKAELHSHCNLDPADYRVCSHSAEQLISEAAGLGYEILAITCHNRDIWNRELADYAENLGITLIPGMEVSTEGPRHVLAYNFRTGPENLNTLAKIRALSNEDTLVIAPHPFFPGRLCLRGRVVQHIDVFDALEHSGFYLPGIDFNRRVRRLALKHDKPVVGNGDVHMLWQLGRTCTWIYSEPGVSAILSAIKRGSVRLETTPLSYSDVVRFWASTLWRYLFPVNPPPAKPVGELEICHKFHELHE
ncbi:MAG TPA: PHP-associated domain-containing protein [Acidobacteriota bacterium]|nr:PHP-associated domain-containing protein [Acidobacteriota bacterium]